MQKICMGFVTSMRGHRELKRFLDRSLCSQSSLPYQEHYQGQEGAVRLAAVATALSKVPVSQKMFSMQQGFWKWNCREGPSLGVPRLFGHLRPLPFPHNWRLLP